MVRRFTPSAPTSSSTSYTMVDTGEPINLLKGWPNPSLLPAKELLEAANAVLTKPDIFTPALCYGPDEGHPGLRQALGQWLADFYGPAVSKWRDEKLSKPTSTHSLDIGMDRIAITGGASQSLGCILSTVTDPLVTRRIWLVAPSYYLAFKVFEDAGFTGRMRAVPEMDGTENQEAAGPNVSWLRQQLKQADEQWEQTAREEPDRLKPTPTSKFPKIYKHIIYCVPNFANPSSVTTSVSVREDLVKCAKEFDALVVCDDVYDMLQWPAQPSTSPEQSSLPKAHLPRIVDVERYLDGGLENDSFGNVISNGSFSKIAAPGVRVGWVEAAPKLAFAVSQAGTTKSGGAPSQLTSTYLTELVTSGVLMNRITKTLQPCYARRYQSMVTAIDEQLVPLGFSLPQPGREVIGGYFLWLGLPEALQSRGQEYVQRAEAEGGVIVASGKTCEVPDDELYSMRSDDGEEQRKLAADVERTKFGGFVRLCFAWEEEERLVKGVMRMAEVAKKMLHE
jgi:DNA-binding transcriptional MocR family regulator